MLSFILGIATCNLHVALNLKFESVNECSHLIGWYLLVTGPTDEYKFWFGDFGLWGRFDRWMQREVFSYIDPRFVATEHIEYGIVELLNTYLE